MGFQMGGYDAIMYRLGGVLPFGQGSPSDDLETLEVALRAYFFDEGCDEITHDLIWRHFVLPSFLLVLQGHLSSDPFRIRINEYFYQYLDQYLPDQNALEEAVFGLLAVLIDASTAEEREMDHTSLSEALYDVFPELSSFLLRVTPTQGPFVTQAIDLNPLAHFMAAIQVFSIFVILSHDSCHMIHFMFQPLDWMAMRELDESSVNWGGLAE